MFCNGSQRAAAEGSPSPNLHTILLPAFLTFKSYNTDHVFRYHLLTSPSFQSFFLVDSLTKSEKKTKNQQTKNFQQELHKDNISNLQGEPVGRNG